MKGLIVILAMVLAGCATGNPSPSPAAPTVVAASAMPTTAPRTASPEPSVPEGFAQVRFRLHLTGGGASAASFGVDVREVGTELPGATLLCSSYGGGPPCGDGFFEVSHVLPIGATVAYFFYQELDPSGSNNHVIREYEFVVDAQTGEKTQSYDIQP